MRNCYVKISNLNENGKKEESKQEKEKKGT